MEVRPGSAVGMPAKSSKGGDGADGGSAKRRPHVIKPLARPHRSDADVVILESLSDQCLLTYQGLDLCDHTVLRGFLGDDGGDVTGRFPVGRVVEHLTQGSLDGLRRRRRVEPDARTTVYDACGDVELNPGPWADRPGGHRRPAP